MKERGRNHSIVGRINSMTYTLMILLGIPVIASLVMTALIARQYAQSNTRMSVITGLKPVIETEIPEAVWTVVSGRASMEESGVEERIREVNQTIDRITAGTAEERKLELIVAGRTMDTLSQYVQRIRENLDAGRPVVENEAVLSEIRGVAALVGSMLNNYITHSIDAEERKVAVITRLAWAGGTAEAVILLLAFLLTARFRKKTALFVQEPVAKLERVTSRLADGDMSARIPLPQVQELWNLTGKVNIMADNLEEMMRQRVEAERDLKKAELRTLQAQINPHFLYNTLDAIVWQAESGRGEEVVRLTRSLSDFFRISLSSGADWIPVTQELKHVSAYLSIQQTRYRDILHYEVESPEGMENVYMLKLLLQPLVENALYHGIKEKRGGGKITVRIRTEGRLMQFTVTDTGKGMPPETLEKLRRMLEEEDITVQSAQEPGHYGFGLRNVNMRIRLYYRKKVGLMIQSGPGGTEVSFVIPIRTKEEIDRDEGLSGR